MCDKKLWSKEDTFSLIAHWELYPELWDVKNKNYKNRSKIEMALKDLAKIFQTTEKEIRRKMHNMRTQFHQQLRRTEKNVNRMYMENKSDEEIDDNFQATWEYFDAMKKICSYNKKISNYKIKTNDNSESFNFMIKTDDDNMKQEMQLEYVDVLENNEMLNTFDSYEIPEMSVKKAKRKTKRNFNEIENDNQFFATTADILTRPTDECQIFGDFVACELRNMQSQELQRKLKITIQRAILKFSELDDTYNTNNVVATYSEDSNAS